MKRDMRATELYREIEDLCKSLRQPGTGQISDAAEANVSRDGRRTVFAGVIVDKLEGLPPTRICSTDLVTGDTRVLTFGPNMDRSPKFSPDGTRVAFLSDREKSGDFQLYLLDPPSGAVQHTQRVDGWVEYLQWSPDGARILLGVAGHGADIAGGQGAETSKQVAEALPSWLPFVETGDETYRWRSTWVYDVASGAVRRVSRAHTNVWECAWCGDKAFASVESAGPGEGLWYSAALHVTKLDADKGREIYKPIDQLGCLAASPSGHQLAIVEGVCSDRGIVAGELKLIDSKSGRARRVDTLGVDIAYVEWRSDRAVLVAGHRGFETVVGLIESVTATFTEVWSSRDISTGGVYVKVAGLNNTGDCVLIGEGFLRAPEIAVIRRGEYQTVKSFNLGYAAHVEAIDSVECRAWKAPDGLSIQGWLLRPKRKDSGALIMNVHGGPVSLLHSVWLGRGGALFLMLAKKGYTIFFPNPRGSTGRGHDFARRVVGDMGGADAHDLLSGLDDLVTNGIADPHRLGVMGGSYGGFMASWLITQDPRFAAAVPVAPITNQVSGHLIGNIPHFVSLFLKDKYNNPGGQYFKRSPIMQAHKVKTPTLNVCGALDRCTPPEEAVQFHHALLENDIESVLVTYPEEGHGVRRWPAVIDYAARVIEWFDKHLRAKKS